MAKLWSEKAAAESNLAVINDRGLGMRRNAARAVRSYEQAALRGHLHSQTNSAVMLLDGDGVEKYMPLDFGG